MKMYCISDKYPKWVTHQTFIKKRYDEITIGKMYDIHESAKDGPTGYICLVCNNGVIGWVPKENFISLSDYRQEQLDKLGINEV